MRFSVVILGGGCGGLWLLHEFASAGYSTLLVEAGHTLGGYASTHGQNRIHRGAMYIAALSETMRNDDPDGNIRKWTQTKNIIDACLRGSEELKRFCNSFAPGALQESKFGGVYLYERHSEANKVMRFAKGFPQVKFEDISPHIQSEEFADLRRIIPTVKYGFLSDEFSFDAERVLKALISRASDFGASVYGTSFSLSDMRLKRTGSAHKLIVDEGIEIEADLVVVSAGVLNETVLHSLIGEAEGYETNQNNIEDVSRIITIHNPICIRNISLQADEDVGYLALVPIGETTSITTDVPIHNLTEVRAWNLIGKALKRRLPGLADDLSYPFSSHLCQKLSNDNHPANQFPMITHHPRHYFWYQPISSVPVFLYSPGKWTLSAVGAKEFVSNLKNRDILSSSTQKNVSIASTREFTVSRRPCTYPAAYTATWDQTVFRIEPHRE
jgi:FAD dependent oxidoreductase